MRYEITVEGPSLPSGASMRVRSAIAQAIVAHDLGVADYIHVRAVPPVHLSDAAWTPPADPSVEREPLLPDGVKWMIYGYVVAAVVITVLALAFGIHRGELFG